MVEVSGSQPKSVRRNAPYRTSQATTKARATTQDSQLAVEVVVDSEEDRRKALHSYEVIEISSDEEDNSSHTLDDVFPSTPDSWPMKKRSSDHVTRLAIHENQLIPSAYQTIATPRKLYRAPRRVIESSESEDLDQGSVIRASEVVELSESSPEQSEPKKAELLCKTMTARTPNSSEDELDGLKNNDSILILDEPKNARKPLRMPNLSKTSYVPWKQLPDLNNDSERSPTLDMHSSNPKLLDVPFTLGRPTSIARTSSSRGKKAPRLSKKAQAAAEQERRVIYAQKLFEELNRSVFEDRLPKETKLNWSKRLLTTAGRAKWHRSRDGVQTTEIELAEKILDSDERIRNTLSHEMCHLASWIIDASPKEVHGSIFKTWSNQVMRARPDIQITTKHNYEIGFKFNWKCLQCSKIYGRHSKSIDVSKVVCGACREGRLIALFETRTPRDPKTSKTSKLAAAKADDSPRSLPIHIDGPASSKPTILTDRVIYVIHDSDSEQDAEIETLATAMGSMTIIGPKSSEQEQWGSLMESSQYS